MKQLQREREITVPGTPYYTHGLLIVMKRCRTLIRTLQATDLFAMAYAGEAPILFPTPYVGVPSAAQLVRA